MEKVTELIARLTAIECFCKDIHYTNVSYQDHLLADRVHDGIDTEIDDIKEQVILSKGELPLSSKEYLNEAIKFIPDINKNENKINWMNLRALIKDTISLLNSLKEEERGTNALFDNIAQGLNTSSALLFIQTRRDEKLNEEVEHDHKAATETPVDRKEFKEEELKPSPAQILSLKYDAENVMVAEEKSALDRVAKKLGLQ